MVVFNMQLAYHFRLQLVRHFILLYEPRICKFTKDAATGHHKVADYHLQDHENRVEFQI